jgi:RHS repeat-associated protein
VNAQLQTVVNEVLPLAASPQLSGNSRLGFAPVASTSWLGFSFSISSNTLGLSGSLYDGRVGSCSTGKERDSESGNDYFGARYYNSTMGRFLIPDWSAKAEPVPYAKLDNPQSLNLYSYVLNNPMTRFDADGHMTLERELRQKAWNLALYGLFLTTAETDARLMPWAQQQTITPKDFTPPAVFQNQKDAVMNTGAGIMGAVQATGVEWGAALYKNSDGTIGATPLRTDKDPGSVGTSDFYTGKDIPTGATRIGDIHGHTGGGPDNGMHMSGTEGDMGTAAMMLKTHGTETKYMVNPAGQIWKFNPATDQKPVLLPWRIQ